MNIAIIGTAGRGDDAARLTKDIYFQMLEIVRKISSYLALQSEGKWTAISGGAAWADHLAVTSRILGRATDLELELPCPLTEYGLFLDSGKPDSRTNPGGISNYYHKLFNKKVPNIDSSRDFVNVKKMGAKFTVGNGFFDRNRSVAKKADHCIALTFGDKGLLKDGGTAATMQAFLKKGTGQSFHIDLSTMQSYTPATVK